MRILFYMYYEYILYSHCQAAHKKRMFTYSRVLRGVCSCGPFSVCFGARLEVPVPLVASIGPIFCAGRFVGEQLWRKSLRALHRGLRRRLHWGLGSPNIQSCQLLWNSSQSLVVLRLVADAHVVVELSAQLLLVIAYQIEQSFFCIVLYWIVLNCQYSTRKFPHQQSARNRKNCLPVVALRCVEYCRICNDLLERNHRIPSGKGGSPLFRAAAAAASAPADVDVLLTRNARERVLPECLPPLLCACFAIRSCAERVRCRRPMRAALGTKHIFGQLSFTTRPIHQLSSNRCAQMPEWNRNTLSNRTCYVTACWKYACEKLDEKWENNQLVRSFETQLIILLFDCLM